MWGQTRLALRVVVIPIASALLPPAHIIIRNPKVFPIRGSDEPRPIDDILWVGVPSKFDQ
jgi:hypothetical protein